MTSITEFLPVPRQVEEPVEEGEEESKGEVTENKKKLNVPPYPTRNRTRPRFVPREQEDFGDGGAYPEISITQFPLDMGRKGRGSSVSQTLAMRVDEDGNADYAAVVKQGEKSDAVVHASYKSLVEKPRDESKLQRPSEEVEAETQDRTRDALEKLVSGKIAAAQPKNFRGAGNVPKPTYVKYTPANTNSKHNSGSSQRIIRMMEAPVDPLEPPKFHQKKVPPAPPSPPAPVMHSPPRKLTAEDAKNWKIPPCISNWKNNKGYTIPLDKRLAADGRGLQDLRINDNFAKLAESLYTAERTARDMVEQRAQLQKHIKMKEKDKKEQELRELAARARAERAGVRQPSADSPPPPPPVETGSPPPLRTRNLSPGAPVRSPPRSPLYKARQDPDDIDRKKREEIREERRREREREMRLKERAGETGAAAKKSKLSRDRDRDVTERLALGQKVSKGTGNDEVMYDQRLFNQGKSGMDSGFAAEDTYNLYDKPLFAAKSDNFLYRPGADDETNTGRFKADKGFTGAKAETNASRSGKRQAPVEFEKDADTSIKERSTRQSQDDPFGFGKFLSDAKKGRSDKIDKALENRRQGTMGAGGSSASALREEYRENGRSGGRSRIDFRSGGRGD
mmetsp:Transcript_4822/g.14529  ORF Transcript_4822/g.14529 Transcript_4822/m.14529 type:complete len:623 (+) Transcript_4822:88-1956(+)|eukprot:CAMPEP_0198732944 /NCGR_PEP_ID=MMETSP1475-20131203/41322_1 /TAXON_ID= ORGANISM="Unidentified sp., Strain CCMP1999" /NCGR_SAMPLE_ID=MMETSP1475 /ASSEMBLY_ACC=CAM_ASM_001111 /LENGTH=622 /DNA_ID=CAMNT_0044496157 /DNA_START=68 /DNA_END=1936 /DNA_ORIENTATION=+